MSWNEPTNLSYAAIREYAEKIGEHHDIYDFDGEAQVYRLIDRLGGQVVVEDRDESLHVNDEGSFTIYLPLHTSGRRDRFTLAHELGHYFLHYLLPKRTEMASFNRGGRNVVETEANVFASSLLMPERHFKRQFKMCGGDVRYLARIFNVSPAAAEVRCKVLGLL